MATLDDTEDKFEKPSNIFEAMREIIANNGIQIVNLPVQHVEHMDLIGLPVIDTDGLLVWDSLGAIDGN